MNFFKSEFVKKELEEISNLQEEIYEKIHSLSFMDKDEKLKYVNLLEDLLTKQRVLYTRMSLSDDEEAKQVKQTIIKEAMILGFPPDTDISYVFSNMTKIIENMKKSIKES